MTKWFTTAVVAGLMATTAGAGRNDEIVARMGVAQKRALDGLTCLSPQALTVLTNRVSEVALRRRMEDLLALDSLAPGIRKHDAEGRAAIHRYLLGKFKDLESAGLESVGSLRTLAAVPVAVDSNGVPGRVTIGARSWTVHPFWPNGAMPSLCPVGGVEGALVDVRDGAWENLNGLDMKGAIAIMDFRGGRNWDRLASLGCQAVIVVEDAHVNRTYAEGLFCNTPVPFPRFYVDAVTGQELRDEARARKMPAARCRLEGGNTFENRPLESFFVYLPPTAPLTYTVRDRDLLDRVAAQYGVATSDLLQENKLTSADLAPGQRLDIPDQPVVYEVKEGDLLGRLAQDYGLSVAMLKDANRLTGAELKTGQVLTIPNLPDAVVLLARMDSVSAVPDLPHGAKVAGDLAFTLAAMEHLATTPGIVRRKGVIFGFLDGDNHGGLASRLLAEYTLLDEGGVRPISSNQAGKGMFRFFVVLGLLIVFGAAGLLTTLGLLRRAKLRGVESEGPVKWRNPVLAGAAITLVGVLIGVFVPIHRVDTSESTSEDLRIRRYEAMDAWLAGGGTGTVDEATARWFAEDWLLGKLEKQRVLLVEARVVKVRLLNKATDAGERRLLGGELKRLDDQIQAVAGIRNQSIKKGSLGPVRQIRAYIDESAKPDVAAELSRQDLTPAALLSQLRAELEEERGQQAIRVHNAAAIKSLRRRLDPGVLPGAPVKPVLAWLVDLSGGTPFVGFGTRDSREYAGPPVEYRKRLEERFHDVAAYAAAQGGWPEEWTFIPPDLVRAEFAVVAIPRAPSYSEFWMAAGVVSLAFTTLNDAQETLDTPRDTLANMNVHNLSVQSRTLLLCVTLGLENVQDSPLPRNVVAPKYGRAVGRTVQFNMRSGIDAKDPVPHAWVYSPAVAKVGTPNSATRPGSRTGAMLITLLNGAYATPIETLSYRGSSQVYAFTFDRERALFSRVLDAAQIGTRKQTPAFTLLGGVDVEKNLILTAVYPKVVFLDVDPVDYSGGMVGTYEVQDAVLNGPPAHYSMLFPGENFAEDQVSASLIFMEPGRKLRLIGRRGPAIKSLLIGPLAEVTPATDGALRTGRARLKALGGDEKPDFKGRGYMVGPVGADRNLFIETTPLLVAGDFNALAAKRLSFFRQYGIRDNAVEEALVVSQAKLREARQARDEHRWQAAIGLARESWGIAQKHYPVILKLGRETVFSVVLLMALLLPASMFLESLLIGGKTIARQLAGTAGIFVAGALFLNTFHPAFKVALSPFVIVIAFVMILMSVLVLGICYQRFEVLVRRARISGGEAESEEISLASSLATAFSLGVSNLKKRPSRTVLTTFTVAALTFSIITFVSVKGREALTSRPLGLDRDVAGTLLAADQVEPPAYQGVMMRNFNWSGLGQGSISALKTEFGTGHSVAARGHYLQVEGGNNADLEGANEIEVRCGRSTAIATAVMVFEPVETQFSGLNRAVSRGAWFRGAGDSPDGREDRFTIILPDGLAADLGIREKDIFDEAGQRKPAAELPKVRMMNFTWSVIGILDAGKANRIRDVNGKSLAAVDYLRSSITPSQGLGFLENEGVTYHLPWERLVIVPGLAIGDVRASWRSVAVKFDKGEDTRAFLRNITLRLNSAMFGNVDGRLSLLTTKTARSVGGLAKILVPIILCILIVANTMMGTVDERKGEVQMLGAIGLSPGQIAFLLMSESTVFSILGIVVGTFTGLGFSKLLVFFPGFLPDLSFNFTSIASMGLAMGTGGIVLLATLLPARKAAALAAPSGMEKWELPEASEGGVMDFPLPFTLTRGNAVGMAAFIRRFLLNHTEATSEDFNCRDVRVTVETGGADAILVSAQLWLQPYDLDVAEIMEMRIRPTKTEGVFSVAILMRRTSGAEDAWFRTNYRFMDIVRQQFLIWRNLDKEARKRGVEEGRLLLQAFLVAGGKAGA